MTDKYKLKTGHLSCPRRNSMNVKMSSKLLLCCVCQMCSTGIERKTCSQPNPHGVSACMKAFACQWMSLNVCECVSLFAHVCMCVCVSMHAWLCMCACIFGYTFRQMNAQTCVFFACNLSQVKYPSTALPLTLCMKQDNQNKHKKKKKQRETKQKQKKTTHKKDAKLGEGQKQSWASSSFFSPLKPPCHSFQTHIHRHTHPPSLSTSHQYLAELLKGGIELSFSVLGLL